jgi:hypothetical protein
MRSTASRHQVAHHRADVALGAGDLKKHHRLDKHGSAVTPPLIRAPYVLGHVRNH